MKNKFLSKSVPRGTRTIWRYLSALILLFSLSIGQMWGDVSLFSTDFTEIGWSSLNNTDKAQTLTIGSQSVYVRANKTGNLPSVDTSTGTLTWGNRNFSNKDCYLAIPVTGVNKSLTITVANGSSNTRVAYAVVAGSTIANPSSTSNTSSANPTTVTIENLTETSYVVFLGRQGSGSTQATSIIITTPAPSCDATVPGNISKGALNAGTLTLNAAGYGSKPAKNEWYWQTAEDGVDESNSGASFNVTAAGTYYVRSLYDNSCWSDAKSFTVTATDLVANYTVVYKDGTTELGNEVIAVASHPEGIADPKKDCYTFAGWMNGTTPVADVTAISGTKDEVITLTASWTPNYASGAYVFQGTPVTTSKTAATIFNGALYFSAMDATLDTGDASYYGWKIKTNNATVKFLVQYASEVKITLKEKSALNVTFTPLEGAETTETASKSATKTILVKAGTMVTLTTTTDATTTLNRIEIAPLYNATYTDGKGDASGSASNVTEVTLPTPSETTVDGYSFTGWIANQTVYKGETAKTAGEGLDAGETYTLTDNTAFTAQWQLISDFDVKFYQGYGDPDVQIGETQSISTGGHAVAPADPTRTGFAFLGWSYDATEAHIVNVAEYAITAATSFTAIWKQVWTVTFDGAGAVNVENGETVASPDSPTQAGKVFQGWYNGESKYDFSATVTGNLALTSKWAAADPNHFYYTYNDDFHFDGVVYKTPEGTVDGGSGTSNIAMTTPYTLFEGAEGITSIVMTDGIYDSKTGAIQAVTALMKVNNNATSKLTVTIKSGYTATLKIKSSGYSAARTINVSDATPASGTTTGQAVTSGAMSVSGIGELSFALNSGSHDLTVTGGTLYIAELDIEATALPTHTVTYKAGEGTGDDVEDADATNVADVPSTFTAPTGKVFNGWKDETNADVEVGTIVSSDMTLTAQWIAVYAVTFNMNGHGAAIDPQDIKEGAKAAKPADPSESGWIFGGWFTDEECTAGNEFDFETPITAATPLFAKWEAIDACFYFSAKSVDADEAITTPANLDNAFGGTVEATSGTFTYTQYGVLIAGGSDKYFTVNLDYALQEGSKITVKMYAGGTSERGLNLRVAGSSSNVYQYKWTPSATEPAQMEYEYEYVVPANSPLIGKKVFYLYRNNNVYLQTVMVKDCAPQDYTVTYKDGETVLGTEQVFENAHPTADGINTHKKGYEFQGWAETVDGAVVDLDDITIMAAKNLFAQYTVKDCSPKGVKFSMAVDGSKISANQYYPATTPAVGDLAVFATVTGGVAQAVNTSTGTTKNFEVKTTPEFKLGGDNSHMRILLDCPLAKNDTIKFTKSEKITLSFDSLKTKSENIAKTTSYYIVPAAYAGEDTIHIWYNGSGVSVNGVQVIRPEIYAVSFNLNGHGSDIAPIDVVKGAKITAPTAPEDEDYAFAGWYKENTLSNEWKFDVDVVTANTTLYAKWIDLSDATLKSLKYGAEEIALQAGVYTYNVELPALTTAVPALTAETSNPNATKVITDETAFDGEGHATSTVVVTPEKVGAATQTYIVNFAKAASVALQDVTGSITWDFNGAVTADVNINNTLTVIANYAGVSLDGADKLEVKGTKFMKSPACVRANQMHFYTTVPGKLTVEYSNTGGSNPVRYLYVNGVKYDEAGTESTAKKGENTKVFVPAGDVELVMMDGSDASKELNIYRIIFNATSDYPRNVSSNYGTLCVEHNVPAGQYFGATFYQIASRNADYDYKIDFEEVLPNEELKAGEPYLFKSNTGKIELFYGAETAPTPISVRGMIGNYEATTLEITEENKNTIYYFAQNKLWLCDNLVGGSLTLNEHRAYIDLTQVPTYAEYEASKQQQQNSAPRRRVSLEMNGEQVATGCENLNISDKPVKMIINGQLFILRGEKMYDAKGQLVK